uniref:MIP18 family-like domain-containing protein n=1 Tax=Trieres chinensis TaxID=1514140 RepID=A0A7S2A8K0_TRICV|mmetsp:Transcript_5588/g.11643  ORF Transcript_5588/g.11643 Transcript_5588/m.11643 type:complete len:338 (+) Transcript_5588:40-1053(+)
MLNPRAPKENANPTVLSVPSRGGCRSTASLGTNSVARYNLRRFPHSADDGGSGGGLGYSSGDANPVGELDGGLAFAACLSSGGEGTETSSGLFFPGSAAASERSAHLALSAAALADPRRLGGGVDPVGVLRAGGFVLPSTLAEGNNDLGGLSGRSTGRGPLARPSFVTVACSVEGKVERVDERKRRARDAIDSDEVYEIIRNIRDPEHPLTLEQLGVVKPGHVKVLDAHSDEARAGAASSAAPSRKRLSTVDVMFTPTIPHCSMATLIGLSLRVKLLRSLPRRFKVTVRIEPGTHASENAVNRQLDDKERVAAALENDHLRGVVDRCIADGMRGNMS